MAVRGWHAGLQRGAGRSLTRPLGGELTRLLAVFEAHCPDVGSRVEWAQKAGEDFGRSGETTLNVHRFDDWLGRGRKTARELVEAGQGPSQAERSQAIDERQRRADEEHRRFVAEAVPPPAELLSIVKAARR